MSLEPDSQYFLELQANTGWGQMLESFTRWCDPQPGQRTLDVGTGPGLLPALFGRAGSISFGLDHDPGMLRTPLHQAAVMADAGRLPFAAGTFDLVTASNILYLSPEPQLLLEEMVRVLCPSGWVCLLNPSERMDLPAARQLADLRGLEGLARDTLINYAVRAEKHYRWTEADLSSMFTECGLSGLQTATRMGTGLVRYARGQKLQSAV